MQKNTITMAKVSKAAQRNVTVRKVKTAFTLAEVLITLAIIGIVAALTIPTLIQNYQERAWGTASRVFEQKLEEALKVMNTQATLAGYNTTQSFVFELANHLKITKICKNDNLTECFDEKIYWGAGDAEPEEVNMAEIKTSTYFGLEDWETETVGLQFADGVTALVAYNPDCRQDPFSNQITGTDCIAMLYDVSGYKAPNTSNKDLYALNVSRLGKLCALEFNGKCFSRPFLPNPLTYEECKELQGQLGLKSCYKPFDNNVFAGAAKRCGGQDNITSRADMAEFMNYIYNTDVFKADSKGYFDGGKYLTLNNDRYKEIFGKDFENNEDFYWTSENYTSKHFSWTFHPYTHEVLIEPDPHDLESYGLDYKIYAMCVYN